MFCLLAASHSIQANTVKQLNHDEFAALAATSMVVDVRTPEEFAEGHVPGAVNIPLATVQDNIAMFGDTDTSIIVYCRSGVRAGKALEQLSDAGYIDLSHLEGDIIGWQEAGNQMQVPEVETPN
jgi:rhodanese-related sulfurtransferase